LHRQDENNPATAHKVPNQNKGGPRMDRKILIDKLADQLKHWDSEIEKLEAKAQNAKSMAQAEYSKQIQELRSKKDAAQAKLEKLRLAGEGAWKELKSGTETAVNDLKNAFQAALAKFK
jgi:hypothetical protein